MTSDLSKQKILEEFKTYGMDASYHYADDTGQEWKFAYPLVDKCMKLAKEHPSLHTEMAEIAKHFIFLMSFSLWGLFQSSTVRKKLVYYLCLLGSFSF